MNNENNYLRSSYREKIVEHKFVAELAECLWFNNEIVDIARPDVDGAGFDLVLHARQKTRHVQLKSSKIGSKTPPLKILRRLIDFPSGCVVWAIIHEVLPDQEFRLDYRFFGSGPGDPLPDISALPPARHTKADSTGYKAPRPSTVQIPVSRFTPVSNISDLINLLFGNKDPVDP